MHMIFAGRGWICASNITRRVWIRCHSHFFNPLSIAWWQRRKEQMWHKAWVATVNIISFCGLLPSSQAAWVWSSNTWCGLPADITLPPPRKAGFRQGYMMMHYYGHILIVVLPSSCAKVSTITALYENPWLAKHNFKADEHDCFWSCCVAKSTCSTFLKTVTAMAACWSVYATPTITNTFSLWNQSTDDWVPRSYIKTAITAGLFNNTAHAM